LLGQLGLKRRESYTGHFETDAGRKMSALMGELEPHDRFRDDEAIAANLPVEPDVER
jgi:hypothetical protein